MDYQIRRIKETEYEILDTFLYEAIYIPEGFDPPARDVILRPELQVYVNEFGNRTGDNGLVAEIDGRIVGAVWTRIMDDYGHVDDETPSIAISLLQGYRGFGIGTKLMEQMLVELRKQKYKKASLSVQKKNYAVQMYKKVGFEIVQENDEEYIMVCKL